MRKRDAGMYCSVYDAAEILGVGDAEVRRKMGAGVWDLGTVEQRDERRVFRIEKTKVLKMAGLTEWPGTRKEIRMTHEAANAARIVLDEFGEETGRRLIDILATTGTVTKLQRRAMEAVIRGE